MTIRGENLEQAEPGEKPLHLREYIGIGSLSEVPKALFNNPVMRHIVRSSNEQAVYDVEKEEVPVMIALDDTGSDHVLYLREKRAKEEAQIDAAVGRHPASRNRSTV